MEWLQGSTILERKRSGPQAAFAGHRGPSTSALRALAQDDIIYRALERNIVVSDLGVVLREVVFLIATAALVHAAAGRRATAF